MTSATLGGPLYAAAQTPVAELRRGFVAVGTSASDEPALRAEPHLSEPYRVGAALAAWENASAALDFLMKNPSGDGDDSDAIDIACYDEAKAFSHLESARAVTGLAAGLAVQAAKTGYALAGAWEARRSAGPAPRCSGH